MVDSRRYGSQDVHGISPEQYVHRLCRFVNHIIQRVMQSMSNSRNTIISGKLYVYFDEMDASQRWYARMMYYTPGYLVRRSALTAEVAASMVQG